MNRLILIFAILLMASAQPAQRSVTVSAQEKTVNRTAAAAESSELRYSKEEFAGLVEKLSEPGGYFDTDNLISNESSYLHVLGKMRQMKVSGGAYIGVGPDQSFSYIAQIRPKIAFITDIRRDNLLQHLLFKSLFALSRNRLEYLCLFFGKPVPTDIDKWNTRTVKEIVEYIDKTPGKVELFTSADARIREKAGDSGLKLSSGDLDTITRFHRAFFDDGLDLKFTSKNRSPRYYYPNYRDLMLEKDLAGNQGNYLVEEDRFQFLKQLEERNLVIPVVGNLAGERALKNIATFLKDKGMTVSALYTSNVEFYLMRGDDFDRFARSVVSLPRDERSVIIRSYFNGTWGYQHPQSVSGYYSTQLMQTMESFVKEYMAGGYQSYSDIISKHMLDLKP